MKGIQEKIKEGNKDFEEGNDIVIEIIRMLCKQFFKNRFSSFGERPHPFIYYKFLRIIQDWTPEIFNDIKDYKNEWTSQKKEDWELKYFVEGVEKKGSKAIFDYFFSEGKIYDDAKYEMYRQMALYNAADMSLFDVKRLIYSLLIAKMNDKYSNNLIKDKVLKLIFDEQLDTNTGLFPVGHVVNTDFVIEGGEIVDKTERIISASPILSSVECLDDMLTHKELKADLEKYHEKLNSTNEWIIKRLRKDSSDKPLGWFPEYESTHTPESWVAGHTLVFLKRYCEMLSELIKKNAAKELQAKNPEELTIEWEKLKDSYEIKRYIEYMTKKDEKGKVVSNSKYRSALIFGPPGSGKSTIVKALAKRLDWDYVELSPSLFLSEGEQNIILKAIEIFKKLVLMKGTVIFFDEVDQLVKSRKKSDEKSVWIVTSLLPMFQKLREQKDIKFILATNDITKVDIAAKRPGRIDAVLPMGAICWQDRLKILRDAISDGNNQIKYLRYAEPQNIFSGLLAENKLKNNKQIDEMVKDDINKDLERFLKQSDFMPFIELKSIVEMLFNKRDWETAKNTEAFKILFSKEDSGRDEYENSEFKKFHKNLVGEPEKTEDKLDKYVHLPMEAEISKGEYIKGVKNTVFWES
nr:AAA family ATPase [uncultured archaeon GZfos13E1]